MFTITEYPNTHFDEYEKITQVIIDKNTVVATLTNDNIQALLNGKILCLQLDEDNRIILKSIAP